MLVTFLFLLSFFLLSFTVNLYFNLLACFIKHGFRVIKSRRVRWAGHVARMGEEKGCIGSWWGNRREGDD